MKVLIAVASKHGSTREIAEAIAEELRAHDLEVDLCDLGQDQPPDNVAATYRAVILGSAIYAGNWLPQAREFAEIYQEPLAIMPVWVFSSGPLGADDPQPHDDPNKLALPLGEVKVRDHHVFVGKLDPSSLGFGERLITRMVKAPYGDFRNWEEIRGWAREIAFDLSKQPQTLSPAVAS